MLCGGEEETGVIGKPDTVVPGSGASSVPQASPAQGLDHSVELLWKELFGQPQVSVRVSPKDIRQPVSLHLGVERPFGGAGQKRKAYGLPSGITALCVLYVPLRLPDLQCAPAFLEQKAGGSGLSGDLAWYAAKKAGL